MFSFTGSSVQSANQADFIPLREENVVNEPKIDAKVRELEKFDLETSTRSVEMHNSSTKSWIDSKEAFDCSAEIPILVIKSDQKTLIWRSNAHDNDIHWEQYRKVTEIQVNSEYGFHTTLADIFREISQKTATNIPLRYRPIADLVQGGQNNMNNEQTIENETNNSHRINDNRQTGNECDNNRCSNANVSNRLKFPIYAPNIFK